MMRCLLGVVILASLATAQTPRDPSLVLDSLRNELMQLQQQAFEEEQHMAELIRLRIAWDLLLAVSPSAIIGTVALPSSTFDELRKSLASELDRESRLRAQFFGKGKGGSKYLANRVPVMPSVIKRTKKVDEGKPIAGNKVESKAGWQVNKSTSFGPDLERKDKLGPRLSQSVLFSPFGDKADVHATILPARTPKKLIAALLAAKLGLEALVWIEAELDKVMPANGHPEPYLLYLKGIAHQMVGNSAQATLAFKIVLTVDKWKNAEGIEVMGIWASSAAIASKHNEWLDRQKLLSVPDLKSLKW